MSIEEWFHLKNISDNKSKNAYNKYGFEAETRHARNKRNWNQKHWRMTPSEVSMNEEEVSSTSKSKVKYFYKFCTYVINYNISIIAVMW